MKNRSRKTILLGDLIAAVYEEAECHSADPEVVSRLATRAVAHMLRHVGPARVRSESP